jgi:hypothetical protein
MWLKQQSQIQRGLFCNLSNSLVCSALEYGWTNFCRSLNVSLYPQEL